ncbi:MAG TPA: extracellular solute-binding protein [Anaerolineaceae bacterium]
MLRKTTFLLLVIALLAAFLLPGCDAVSNLPMPTQLPFNLPGARTPTPAEKTLLVYTVLSEAQINAYKPIYEQENPGHKLILERASTWELVRKMIAEKNAPRADVVWGLAATAVLRLQAEGILAPYEPDAEGLRRLGTVNPRMRDRATPPYWIGHDVFVAALCVNSAKMDEQGLPYPKSWQDLIDPVYRNKIVMSNPNISGTGFMTISAWIQQMGEANAWKYMEALDKNIIMYTDSGRKPCTLAADGKAPIGISFGSAANDERKRGVAVEAIYPEEGSGWEVETIALIKKDVINPDAVKFVTWAIGDSAMQAYAKFYPLTSVKTNITTPPGFTLDPITALIPNRFLWASANYDRIVNDWTGRFESKAESSAVDVPEGFR